MAAEVVTVMVTDTEAKGYWPSSDQWSEVNLTDGEVVWPDTPTEVPVGERTTMGWNTPIDTAPPEPTVVEFSLETIAESWSYI